MKIQDFNHVIASDQRKRGNPTQLTPSHKSLELLTATLAFLLPAILLFLIAAK